MATSRPLRIPRIIVADDHEWILQILVSVVHETLPEAEVIATVNGLEALRAYEAGGADFLVTNHQMPEMNGMTLIQRVRQVEPALPILMVSVKPEARADAMAAGASWFLSKEQIMEQMPPLLLRYTGSLAGPSSRN